MCVHILNFSNDTKKNFNVVSNKKHKYDLLILALSDEATFVEMDCAIEKYGVRYKNYQDIKYVITRTHHVCGLCREDREK